MKSTRIFSFFLAALLLTLSGCGNAAPADTVTTAPDDKTDPAEPAKAHWYDSMEARDFEGAVFRILAWDQTSLWSQALLEMGSGEENGDLLNDAIYKRNLFVEEQFNLTLEITNDTNAANTLKNAVYADEHIADIGMMALQHLSQYSDQGMFYDLTQSSSLDFDRPYWDQNAKKDLAIMNRLTYMVGDLTPMTGQGTWIMYFNKDLLEKYQLDNPYDLVDSNKWTGDTMFAMAKRTAADLDGNTIMDDLDQYGLLVQNGDVQMFYQGFGERYTDYDEEGWPVLVLGSTTRATDVFEKIGSFFADTDTTLCSNRFNGKYPEAHTVSVQTPCFQQGRALFYLSGVLRLFQMRDYSIDFGVLPMPKYDESQENYSHTVKLNWGSGVCIPKTAENFDDISFVLEALAAASAETVKPAYYETTLGVKLMRDERSYDMLDIVMQSRSFDAMCFYQWGGIVSALNTIGADGGEGFMSAIESTRMAIDAAIRNTVDAIVE